MNKEELLDAIKDALVHLSADEITFKTINIIYTLIEDDELTETIFNLLDETTLSKITGEI